MFLNMPCMVPLSLITREKDGFEIRVDDLVSG